MKRLFSLIASFSILWYSLMLNVVSADSIEQPVCIIGTMDYALTVQITGDISEIKQIGDYPVTTEASLEQSSIQIVPFAEEKTLLLDWLHTYYNPNIELYESYCGSDAIFLTDEQKENIYYLNIPKSNDIEKSIINSIALDSDIDYLGKAVLVTQCDHYRVHRVYVYVTVSDETEAVLTSDPRFQIDEYETERIRAEEPNVYVLQSADQSGGPIGISYEDYLEYKTNIEARLECTFSFEPVHRSLYCSDCRVGLEIYSPTHIMGDVTGDTAIDIADAQMLLFKFAEKLANQHISLTDWQVQSGDINTDGMIDVADAQIILQYYTCKDVAKVIDETVSVTDFWQNYDSYMPHEKQCT